ncbi:hypothetical protein ACFQ08_34310 [Streptosporangium algeriense]|uniref:Uncharacterized protein n=1 Tax=Streptosporangium algeriense TaxID=1682748 RepID=A0ABW3E0V1_9ACTN
MRHLSVLSLAALTALAGTPALISPAQAAALPASAKAPSIATQVTGEGPGCGGHQADWRSATLTAGFFGSVRATFWNGNSGTYGKRRVAVVPGGVVPLLPNGGLAVIGGSVEDIYAGQPKAFSGTGTTSKRGYTWTVAASSGDAPRPGGTATLLNPRCAAGSTTVISATYHYQSKHATGPYIRTLTGTLSRKAS